jgi:hypothetical protein
MNLIFPAPEMKSPNKALLPYRDWDLDILVRFMRTPEMDVRGGKTNYYFVPMPKYQNLLFESIGK